MACVIALLVFSHTYRGSMRVVLACGLLLIWWRALARTKTLSWRAVSLLFSASIGWAPVVAWGTTLLSERVAHSAGYLPPGPTMAGPGTAIAALGEESLKLVPLLLVVVFAPGRVRGFSCADWLLGGLAAGLGFQLFEDSARRVSEAVTRPGLMDVLLGGGQQSGLPQYSLGPLSGGSSQLTGTGAVAYAGHHVLSALVTAGVGLGVAAWRHAGRSRLPRAVRRPWLWRCIAVALPAALFWLVVVDHFSYNASSAASDWSDPVIAGREPTAPGVLRWSFRLLGHGFGRGWLLLLLLVVAMLVDAHKLAAVAGADARRASLVPGLIQRAGDGVAGWAGSAVRAVRDLLVLMWGDLEFVTAAHRCSATEGGGQERRAEAARLGMTAAVMLRWERAERVAAAAAPPATTAQQVLSERRRVRALGVCALIVVGVIAVAVAPALAEHVGTALTRPSSAWLAGVLDSLGTWWNGLPSGQKAVTLIALGTVVALATGGLGSALFVSGIASYGLTHAHGLASLARDPKAAARDYFTHLTPQGAALDALGLGLTFIPVGTGAIAGTAVKAEVAEFARDPDAYRAAALLVRE